MKGDDKVRHCSLCQLNVYNLPGMTEAQVGDLVARTEGRLCVRMFERTDGRVMAADCPVPFRAVRKRLAVVVASALCLLLSGLVSAGVIAQGDRKQEFRDSVKKIRTIEPFRTFLDKIDPPSPPMLTGDLVVSTTMGKVALRPKKSTP